MVYFQTFVKYKAHQTLRHIKRVWDKSASQSDSINYQNKGYALPNNVSNTLLVTHKKKKNNVTDISIVTMTHNLYNNHALCTFPK